MQYKNSINANNRLLKTFGKNYGNFQNMNLSHFYSFCFCIHLSQVSVISEAAVILKLLHVENFYAIINIRMIAIIDTECENM